MKLKTKLFGKTFFELETENEIKTFVGADFNKTPETQATQLQYIIGDTQYENLLKAKSDFEKFTNLVYAKKENDIEASTLFKSTYGIIDNLIKSYEHFKEKRDALKTSN